MDCKAEPYHLLCSDADKQEVAKDVASFANANGGVILLGVGTQRSSTHFGDEVERIRTFAQDLIGPQQFYDVLRDWVYPVPQRLHIKWWPSSGDADSGIIAIEVPPQTSDSKPFLIKRVIDTGRRVEIVFGYVERRRDGTEHWSIEKIQNYLKDGSHYNDLVSQQYETILARLEKLEALSSGQRAEAVPSKPERLITERILEALLEVHLSGTDRPAFVLAAVPKQRVTIRGLFETKDTEVVKLIENPPELPKGNGFDINIGARSRIIKGELRRAIYEGHESLELWRDGTLILVARGDGDFLCWGSATRNSGRLIINQLAMIDATFLFVQLSKQVYNHASGPVTEIDYRLGFYNAAREGKPVGLIPGRIDSVGWRHGQNLHIAPDVNHVFSIEAKEGEPTGVITHRILALVYNWFGIETSQIPYVEKVGSEQAISAEKITEAGSR
jgi:hypothetical protein